MSYYTGYFFTLYGYGIKRAKISHAVGTSKLVKDVSYIFATNGYPLGIYTGITQVVNDGPILHLREICYLFSTGWHSGTDINALKVIPDTFYSIVQPVGTV